jgi:ribosomal protein S4
MRLDHAVTAQGLTISRSQAESYIRLGKVEVSGKVVTKPGFNVTDLSQITLTAKEQYEERNVSNMLQRSGGQRREPPAYRPPDNQNARNHTVAAGLVWKNFSWPNIVRLYPIIIILSLYS